MKFFVIKCDSSSWRSGASYLSIELSGLPAGYYRRDLKGRLMEYYAVGLAVLGGAVGAAFRWKVLLPIIGLLPFASIIFSISRGFGLVDTTIVILVAEAILQGGYLVGLLIRATATRSVQSKRRL
jgi:hypothetical protein